MEQTEQIKKCKDCNDLWLCQNSDRYDGMVCEGWRLKYELVVSMLEQERGKNKVLREALETAKKLHTILSAMGHYLHNPDDYKQICQALSSPAPIKEVRP